MHFVCASSLQKHLYKNEEHMHLNRRVMRSNYRRFVGRVTDWFEEPVRVTVPVRHRLV